MSTTVIDDSSNLKIQKLNVYWTKYSFLRKRIHKDILFLFEDFENMELINFLINNSYDEESGSGKLLNLMNVIKNLDERLVEKYETKLYFFKGKSRTISNKTIIDDIDKFYNSLTFQFTRKNF
jgi:hypothetical protein